jgi:CRP-like cAMP-binding protein
MKVIDNPVLLDKFIHQFRIDEAFMDYRRVAFELVSFDKGEMLCTESEQMNDFLVILMGSVQIYSFARQKEAFDVITLKAPEIIGAEAYVHGQEAVYSAVARSEVLCLMFSMHDNRHTLDRDIHFYRYLCRGLADRLVMTTFMKENKKAQGEDSSMRLLSYLKLVTGEDRVIRQNLGEISRALGISYRQTVRLMNQLCDGHELLRSGKGSYMLR